MEETEKRRIRCQSLWIAVLPSPQQDPTHLVPLVAEVTRPQFGSVVHLAKTGGEEDRGTVEVQEKKKYIFLNNLKK